MQIKQLLERQMELQRAGVSQGHSGFSDAQLEMAYLDEVGELVHELKPLWVWWKKPGMQGEVGREKALGEAADILHFALLRDLREHGGLEATRPYGEWDVQDERLKRDLPREDFFKVVYALTDDTLNLVGVLSLLVTVADVLEYTVDDLIQAYLVKTDENLKRWEDAK